MTAGFEHLGHLDNDESIMRGATPLSNMTLGVGLLSDLGNRRTSLADHLSHYIVSHHHRSNDLARDVGAIPRAKWACVWGRGWFGRMKSTSMGRGRLSAASKGQQLIQHENVR